MIDGVQAIIIKLRGLVTVNSKELFEAEVQKSSAFKVEKTYEKPVLQAFGDVRDVTLGGSVPGTESLGNTPEGCQIGIDLGCT